MKIEPNGPWCDESIKIAGVWHSCVIIEHGRGRSHHEASTTADSGETVRLIWFSEDK